MPHPIPRGPQLAPPTSGKMALHFGNYSTSRMIEMIQQILPGPDDDADLFIAEAHDRDEASQIDLLA